MASRTFPNQPKREMMRLESGFSEVPRCPSALGAWGRRSSIPTTVPGPKAIFTEEWHGYPRLMSPALSWSVIRQSGSREDKTENVMTKTTHIGTRFVRLTSAVASRLGGVVLAGRRWVIAAAVAASQARSCGDITVHAVQDRFGAATSFVNDSGQLWAWGANSEGQYGEGTREMTVTAKKLGYPEGVTRWSLFRTGARFFALDQDRRLYAWGEPEVALSTPRGSAQTKATLLGTDRWLDVVAPEFLGPFGLGVDQGGRLRWLRAAAPATRDIAPFAEFRTTDATGPDLPSGFASVAAGAHGFLALTTDGRVFAAGIPASGFRGPKAPLVGDTFSDEFFGVPAPAQATRWTRIAVVYDLAMAWADDGKLYTWGDRNIAPSDGSPRVDPVPSPAPPVPGCPVVEGGRRGSGRRDGGQPLGARQSRRPPRQLSTDLVGTSWSQPGVRCRRRKDPVPGLVDAHPHLLPITGPHPCARSRRQGACPRR